MLTAANVGTTILLSARNVNERPAERCRVAVAAVLRGGSRAAQGLGYLRSLDDSIDRTDQRRTRIATAAALLRWFGSNVAEVAVTV